MRTRFLKKLCRKSGIGSSFVYGSFFVRAADIGGSRKIDCFKTKNRLFQNSPSRTHEFSVSSSVSGLWRTGDSVFAGWGVARLSRLSRAWGDEDWSMGHFACSIIARRRVICESQHAKTFSCRHGCRHGCGHGCRHGCGHGCRHVCSGTVL